MSNSNNHQPRMHPMHQGLQQITVGFINIVKALFGGRAGVMIFIKNRRVINFNPQTDIDLVVGDLDKDEIKACMALMKDEPEKSKIITN